MTEPKAIHTAGDDDASPAYQSAAKPTRCHAITRHPSGANLSALETWHRTNIAPEPVLRGLLAHGYFVWRDTRVPGEL
jgi:hypothetical protein